MNDSFGRQQQHDQRRHRERAKGERRAIDHDADEHNSDHDEGALGRNFCAGKQKVKRRGAQGGKRRPFFDWVTAVLFCPKPCWQVAGSPDFVRFGPPAVLFCPVQLRTVG